MVEKGEGGREWENEWKNGNQGRRRRNTIIISGKGEISTGCYGPLSFHEGMVFSLNFGTRNVMSRGK
jgi:hypothetical protein